jgi:mono/diheme cytochrome c family protein
MLTRYGAAQATGLTEADAKAIVEYLATIRPPEAGRRPLRASVLAPEAPAEEPPARSGGPPGPVEPPADAPRAAASPATGRPPAEPDPRERLPVGPDPVLAEGRAPKPIEALAPEMRDAVQRGFERWQAEGCGGCHPSDAEVRAWAGAFPQVPLFRPEEGVATLTRAVEHWRRRPGGPLDAEIASAGGDTDLVAYLAWRADGAPMAPGRAYPLPPAVDLETLEQAVAAGRALAEGAADRPGTGACGGCHAVTGAPAAGTEGNAGQPRGPRDADQASRGGGAAPARRAERRPGGPLPEAREAPTPRVPEISGSAAAFPRFAPELGRVGTLEEYLTAHLAVAFAGDPVQPPELGRRGSRELTSVLSWLAWLARDRLVDVGRPPGARPRGSAELGREIYQLRCGICHDPGGREPGPLGPGLAGLFDRARLSGRPHDPESVTRVIRGGARGMPAFIDLSTAQLEDLLAYLRTL